MPNENKNAQVHRLTTILINGYEQYFSAFAAITRRARHRFETRDWSGMRKDTVERLDLYPLKIAETCNSIQDSLGIKRDQRSLWVEAKKRYFRVNRGNGDTELAMTFYNSVNRKILNTVGFDPELSFSTLPAVGEIPMPTDDLISVEQQTPVTAHTIEAIIEDYTFETPFVDPVYNTATCADRINTALKESGCAEQSLVIELLRAPFFRGMSAYLVGRLICGDSHLPLVLALNNSRRGLYIDAVLTTPDQIRIMFSFSRAYFHVETAHPSILVDYLKALLPGKRLAEIYIGLGFHKHGKTELYRDLLKHQEVCGEDRFDFSPGKHGMVMIAFNMPNDDLIYKLIRDRFDTPKKTTAKQVMQKYDYVFKHDRAGRLVDVQTFDNLELDECCFTPQLLEEISSEARKAATIDHGSVILHHAYVERRVTPLDVFIGSAAPNDAEAAVIDFGQAIKDLAHINVFPGDMLIKNFGVTTMGRVVFYDYDELCPLTDCNFRKLPQARHYDDEVSAEPWYSIGDHDVFPEEFASFLGLPPMLREVFMTHHSDLLNPEFWKTAQHHIRIGTWFHIRPYGHQLRLPRKNSATEPG